MAQRPAKNSKKSHTSQNIRPTSGKVLLALFNILQSSGHIAGCRFLDLFAGTGDVSLMGLSRGAAFVVAIESDRLAAAAISRRFASLPDPGSASVMTGDVRRIVPKLARRALEDEADASRKFDVVFADPPYCLGWGEALPRLLEENLAILSEGGVFVFEHSAREKLVEATLLTRTRDDRIYGETVLSIYWPYRQSRPGAGETREEDVF